MKNLTIGIGLEGKDLSFVEKACKGGISTDPTIGESLYFDDVMENYAHVSDEEFKEFIDSIKQPNRVTHPEKGEK